MRTTKVIAFSVPPEFEKMITKHAEQEHRTISEYIREALRHYMTARSFEDTQREVQRKMKKKGLGVKDVNQEIEKLRK